MLRIGFLNHADAAPHMAAYSAAFDLVVLAGGSMQPALDVLAAVAGAEPLGAVAAQGQQGKGGSQVELGGGGGGSGDAGAKAVTSQPANAT